jgi:hypothetical protein
MLGSFARYIDLDESEGIDINDLDKVNNLSKKLCKNVVAKKSVYQYQFL